MESAKPKLRDQWHAAMRPVLQSAYGVDLLVLAQVLHLLPRQTPSRGNGAEEVTAFLNWLATDRKVAAATQNRALNAILFLYKQVLGKKLPWFDGLVRAKRPVRMAVARDVVAEYRVQSA
jgi:hypothetical protein